MILFNFKIRVINRYKIYIIVHNDFSHFIEDKITEVFLRLFLLLRS